MVNGQWCIVTGSVGIGVYPVNCLPIETFLGLSGSVGCNVEGVASRIWIGVPGDCLGPCYPEGNEEQWSEGTGEQGNGVSAGSK